MSPIPTETPRTPQHITTLPFFSPFQERSTITKAIEEIFEVNTNKDAKDIKICGFNQDTS